MKNKIVLLTLLMLLLCGCSSQNYQGTINVLNWSSYIPNEVIDDFEKEYNIKVNYNTYSSNEELLAKITSSREGTYDLIFPSDYMVELMKNKDLLLPLDKSKISNINNINPIFLNQPFDSENEYSLPFLAASIVIAVNRDNVKENINSYNDLLNPKYKNNIVLIDDQRIIIGLSLIAQNYNMNDINTLHLKEGKNWLLQLKDNIKAYDSDSPKTFLITNEVDMGIMWDAEAKLAHEENPNIEIIYPIEGHALSLDNYVLLKGSKNIENAYLFINYLLRNDVNKKIIEEYPYISTLSVNNMDNNLEYIVNKGIYVQNIGDKINLYDKIWAEIK